MRRPILLIAAALLALGATNPALAKNDKGNNPGNKGGDARIERSYDNDGDAVLKAAITAAEIAIIYDWIANNGAASLGYPAGGQGLPPGIAKNLARGKPLPPGIAKNYLPQGLLGRLPARPGYEWQVIDNDIFLVVAATSIIVDVLRDAF